MKFYHLTFLSKNKRSLNFLFSLIDNNSTFKFNTFTQYHNKQIKIKKLTLLKSPHVNKTAQEQFETHFFFQQFNFYSPESFKYLVFLKKLISVSFSDISLKIKIILNKKIENNLQLKILYPTNFKLNKNYYFSQKYKLKKKNNYIFNDSQKIKLFVTILNSYGELQT